MEGVSTPQKLMSLETNKNLIYGLEVGPGVELLKIAKKNVNFIFFKHYIEYISRFKHFLIF